MKLLYMKKILVLLTVVLYCATCVAQTRIYKLKKLELGFQNSAAGLFLCENTAPHFTHLIIEEDLSHDLYFYLYNSNLGGKPFIYKMLNPQKISLNSATYKLKRTSSIGPKWTCGTMVVNGKKMTFKVENANDQWDDKIFYIYTAKRTKSEKGLEGMR